MKFQHQQKSPTLSVVDKTGMSLLNDFISKTGDVVSGTLHLDGNETKLVFLMVQFNQLHLMKVRMTLFHI